MDKRWRNLGILVLIIIVIVAGLILYSGNFSLNAVTGQKVSLDSGYSEILGLFKTNDVNFQNVQDLNMVYLSENGKIVWVESKTNLNNLRSGLANFSGNISSRAVSTDAAGELKSASDLYISAIDFGIKSEGYWKSLSDLNKSALTCADSGKLATIKQVYASYYSDLSGLSAKNESFAQQYNIGANLLVIDLENEKQGVDNITGFADAFAADCNGGSA